MSDGVRQTIQANGRELSYLDWGSPTLPPLVFVHGFMGAASNFWEVGVALEAEFHVLAPDLRGHGFSAWDVAGDYSMESYQRDLVAWAAELGLGRFALCGHSLGGPTVAIYAARHPEQVTRLILEDPARFGSNQRPPQPPAGTTPPRRGGLFPELPLEFPNWAEAEKAGMAAITSPRPTKESNHRYLESNLLRHSDGHVTWRLDRAGLMAWLAAGDPLDGEALYPFVEQLRCPTLVLRGGSSMIAADPLRRMAALNLRVTYEEIASAGHGIHFDQPEAFLSALRGFMRQPLR
ncbi:MAG: alpha/beta fold hydrolase [Chloroflexota bacterium]